MFIHVFYRLNYYDTDYRRNLFSKTEREEEMETIEKIKKKYKNEWVLLEVLEENELNQPTNGKIIAHSKNRDDIYDALKGTKGKHTYQFWTGEIPEKGYAVAFVKRCTNG